MEGKKTIVYKTIEDELKKLITPWCKPWTGRRLMCTGRCTSRKNFMLWEEMQSKISNSPIFISIPIKPAEKIIEGYKNCPPINRTGEKAFYLAAKDTIIVPPMNAYKKKETYYKVLYHEMAHSTGHKSRLNRPNIIKPKDFNIKMLVQEEMNAEISTAILCGIAGISHATMKDSVLFLAGLLEKTEGGKEMFVLASIEAQKIVAYIQGLKPISTT